MSPWRSRVGNRFLATAALAVAGVVVTGWLCSFPHRQSRRVPSSGPALLALPFKDQPVPAGGPLARQLADHSLFRYGPADRSGPSYVLGIVEFDDQGFLWDERQVETLRQHVLAEAAGRGIILVTFMHGWNHTAATGDNNIGCFQEVLESVARLDHAVNGQHARLVVGVYLGWRGQLFRPIWMNRTISFWDRMAASDRIGDRGDLLHVLAQLGALRLQVRGERENVVVLTGHSMGARALFSAVGGHLKASLSLASVGEGEVRGIGDMMVLVNPALSAADYRVVDRLSSAATIDDAMRREPIFVLLSSQGDQVLRRLYSLGEHARTWVQSIGSGVDRELLHTTAATYSRFVTHRLRVIEGQIPPLPRHADMRGCRCRSLVASELACVRGVAWRSREYNLFDYRDMRIVEPAGVGRARLLYRLALEPVRRPETRLMVIETDRAVMPDHGEMFTPALVEFLLRMVNSKIRVTDARAAGKG